LHYLTGKSSGFSLNQFIAFSPSTWRSWSSVIPGILPRQLVISAAE
jgi:hypothetical protein